MKVVYLLPTPGFERLDLERVFYGQSVLSRLLAVRVALYSALLREPR